VWPFDAELAAFRLGLRALIRREGLDEREAEVEREYYRRAGLDVRWIGPPHRTLIAATNAAVLEEAAAREAANVSADASFADAARWFGEALGYPSCCVESFVRIRRRDEKLLLAEHLPPLGHATAPAATVWINGALALISHAPCALTCSASIALGKRILDELERAHPGFGAAWSTIAKRVHAIDRAGTVLALDMDGPLDGGRIVHALEIELPAGPRSDLARTRDDLVGLVTTIRDHQWTTDHFIATLVADHRG
jgi:hypothetical protein